MIAIVLASMLWGTTGVAATLLPTDVDPLAIGAATMSIGGVLLAVSAPRLSLSVIRGGPAAWKWLAPGMVGVVVYPLSFYTSMALAGVAIGNVVSLGTAPLFAAALEYLFAPPRERRLPTLRWRMSAGTAIVGIALLAGFGRHGVETHQIETSGTDVPLGVALGAVAGLAYATYSYTAGRLIADGWSSRGTVAAQFALGGLALLPVLAATGSALLGGGTPRATLLTDLVGAPPAPMVIAYLAVGPMVVAYLLFGHGLRRVTASHATTVTLLEPVVATLLAVTLVGERLTTLGWLGLLLVLAGVAAVVTEHDDRRRAQQALSASNEMHCFGTDHPTSATARSDH